MGRINWIAIKKDYLTDPEMGYDKLAEKYGINPTTVAVKGGKEGWVELRNKSLEKIQEKTIEKASDTIANFQAEKLRIGKYVIAQSVKAMQEKQPRNFREAREGLDSGYKLATEAMGLNDPKILIQNNQQNNIYTTLNDFMAAMEKRVTENG